LANRLLAFIIDHIISTVTVIIIFTILSKGSLFLESNNQDIMNMFTGTFILGFAYYFLKDVYQGRSIGKRICKVAVRDIKDKNLTPNFWRLVLRNVTIMIWPVELIILLVSGRRIGDIIASTQVIEIVK
jgi:uncharacterized RDD family membrane protein YckC